MPVTDETYSNLHSYFTAYANRALTKKSPAKDLLIILGWGNQNTMGQKVEITDESIGVSQLLGSPQSLRL